MFGLVELLFATTTRISPGSLSAALLRCYMVLPFLHKVWAGIHEETSARAQRKTEAPAAPSPLSV